jgi:hypothetical protein
MKFLFTFILASFFLASSAKKPDHLSISAGKNAGLEIRYTAKFKKNTTAVITVTNAEGKLMSTQTNALNNDNSIIYLSEAANLPEGTYTVQMKAGKKTIISQFVVWK